jgi:hypothetical protein
MSCGGDQNCTCGCCAGTSVQTPQGENNTAGLSAIAYRTGTWATFKESMLARLSSSDYPALTNLKTRDDDDYSIALLDASAVVLDILTFYQERLANESYLRTATQLYSLTQLSRLIGYQPSPGVSASTYLAFTLSSAPGLPTNLNTTAITIPLGTTVQSVPAQGQTPQSFETSAAILAKPDWNALPVQTGVPWVPEHEPTSVYLAGTSTQLNPGDAFLIVGDERLNDPTSPHWDVRIVNTVTPDAVNQRTLITWLEPLGWYSTKPAKKNPVFYALRQKAALFGYNAMNPSMLSHTAIKALAGDLTGTSPGPYEWDFSSVSETQTADCLIDLDAVYTKVVVGGWVVLLLQGDELSRTPSGDLSLYQIQSANTITRSDYGMSAKITRAQADFDATSHAAVSDSLGNCYGSLRATSALAQSEALPVAEQPLDHPLYGTFLDLEVVRQDLVGVTAVAISGKRQKMVVNTGVTGLVFIPDDGTTHLPVKQGDTLTLLQPPDVIAKNGTSPSWSYHTEMLTLLVADSSGRSGTVAAELSQFTLTTASKSDPNVQEFGVVANLQLIATPFAHTRIVLTQKLVNCYDRTVTTVNANVGPATGGGSVTELLGSGAAATPNQAFTLKQSPLTYTQAATPTGGTSSLEVTVNGAAWEGVPTLYAQTPNAQVFATVNQSSGGAIVQFGDGIEGATVPTGQNNIMANYRVGIGSAGNVASGSITTLVDRPVGVSGVTNPTAATGGQDAQSVDDIRVNAPLSVKTLGRAVSITDYQNFAVTFAGISKASAIWIPNGVNRGVFLTVAGVDGASIANTQTLINLTNALIAYGNPQIAINVQSFYETIFKVRAAIAYDPAYDMTAVNNAVTAALLSTYSFASRNFGQGVSADEVATLIQGITGVIAVNVTHLKVVATSSAGDIGSAAISVSAWNNWIAQKQTVPRVSAGPARICPYIPMPSVSALLPPPAEILVLDPDPSAVVLEVMQ